jgi:hypothetical protein
MLAPEVIHAVSLAWVCRASSTSCGAQAGATGLPFLSRLDEQTAPAIKALEGQEQPFAIMRRAQHEILHALSDQLGLEGQATRVSDDGLKVYNTEDGLSSIALQAGDNLCHLWP